MSESISLTVDQALSIVERWTDESGRERTHAFMGSCGADWDWESAVETITHAQERFILSRQYFARIVGHGLGVYSAAGRGVAFQTNDAKLYQLESSLIPDSAVSNGADHHEAS